MRPGGSLRPPDTPTLGVSRGHPGFGELMAALPVAVIVIDPDDRITHVNSQAEQMLNLSERLMLGQMLDAILPSPPRLRDRDGHALSMFDLQIATTRGLKVRVDLVASAVPDHAGWYAIALHHAASARRLGYSADRAGGARAAVGAAAMLAHEIKNPLSGIRGAAQLLGAGELTTLITTEVDRITALIDNMQDFSDTRPLPLTAENIYPLISHASALAVAGFARGIDIEERFDPSLPPARINRDALLQILINLLKNAREAVRGEREPKIVVTTAYRHGLALALAPDKERRPLPIEICVMDNGPGAPADIADRLFDPFISGRPEGRGLGLALVDKLTHDMEGVVQYAREGETPMTVFRLLLPRGAA